MISLTAILRPSKPFETLAALAPQGEDREKGTLMLRSARRARLEASFEARRAAKFTQAA